MAVLRMCIISKFHCVLVTYKSVLKAINFTRQLVAVISTAHWAMQRPCNMLVRNRNEFMRSNDVSFGIHGVSSNVGMTQTVKLLFEAQCLEKFSVKLSNLIENFV